MHVYIYDDHLADRRHQNELAAVETRLTDLGLSGKIIRLDVMKNSADAVARELRQGAKTVVAVGNDRTVHRVVNAIAAVDPADIAAGNVPLGLIPVGREDQQVAAAIGIAYGAEACDALAARRIEIIDLGLANQEYFLTEAAIVAAGTKVELDGNFSLELLNSGELKVINLPLPGTDRPDDKKFSPQDGRLELLVSARQKKLLGARMADERSVFSFQSLVVINEHQPIMLDGAVPMKTPADIRPAKRKLAVIVGRERTF